MAYSYHAIKIRWIIWSIVTIAVIVISLVFQYSIKTTELPITLSVGNKYNISVFHFVPNNLIIRLGFQREKDNLTRDSFKV